jgi:hypothetical protein
MHWPFAIFCDAKRARPADDACVGDVGGDAERLARRCVERERDRLEPERGGEWKQGVGGARGFEQRGGLAEGAHRGTLPAAVRRSAIALSHA